MPKDKEIVKQLTRIADAQERLAASSETEEQEKNGEILSDAEKMKRFIHSNKAKTV
ncbi:hypothetical protein [Peribacillus glennii]|uniref:hypothetical protein n=1 Tax=Peribacillus glennii TaxID=2303991 RepID=UPI0013147D2B|nr:hypothetical protein [Peribacillus glennii]